jgi:hypothetical protein
MLLQPIIWRDFGIDKPEKYPLIRVSDVKATRPGPGAKETMKPTARGIQPFDDRPYIASIQALRDCLAAMRLQHAAALERYPVAKPVDTGKPKRKATASFTHVYVLPTGVKAA